MRNWFSQKAAIIFVSIFLIVSCDSNDRLVSGATTMINSEKEVLFKMILDHPDFQQYLHPELEGRVPLKVKSNDELGTDLSIEKFGQAIRFVDAVDSDENTPLLDVVAFNISGKQVRFDIRYEIEGVTLRGMLEQDAGEWKFKSVEVFES